MRPIGDPNYVYRPVSDEAKRKMRLAALARYGCAEDERMLYGFVMKEDVYARLLTRARRAAEFNGKQAAIAFVRQEIEGSGSAAPRPAQPRRPAAQRPYDNAGNMRRLRRARAEDQRRAFWAALNGEDKDAD